MYGEGWRANAYKFLIGVEVVSIGAGAIFGASTKLTPSTQPLQGFAVLWNDMLVAAQPNAWWVVSGAAVLTGLAHGARKTLGAPWLWSVVNNVLNTLQKELFAHHASVPDHLHRVTLFRYRRCLIWPCLWPWSGWLVPVARSGYSTRQTNTIFMVPQEPTLAQGVAGKAFVHRGMMFIPEPKATPSASGQEDLPHVSPEAGNDAIEAYARRTHTPGAWVKKRLKKRQEDLPKSYCGIPIDVKGRRWGAIVIDSADERLEPESVDRAFRLVGGTLSSLLEGVL